MTDQQHTASNPWRSELVTPRERFKSLQFRAMGAIVLTIPLLIFSMFFANMPYADLVMWALATPALGWFGRGFFRNAWRQAKHRKADMNTLVAVTSGLLYMFSVISMLFPDLWAAQGIAPRLYFDVAAAIVSFILWERFLRKVKQGKPSSRG